MEKYSQAELQANPIVLGSYRLLEEIGSGGWASVYKAKHEHLPRFAAVKLLHRRLTFDEDKQQRFRREAENISKIDSPHVVALLDYGFTDDNQPFLVMEYIEGITLEQHLETVKRMSVEETLSLARDVCSGLKAAHEAGIIHRDLKPANLLLHTTEQGRQVKIMDFGIAKTADEDQATSGSLTKTGETLGTPFYMSPEQCMGKQLDARSDLYSLGCMMYEMLTGTKFVCADSTYECMVRHVEGPPPEFSAEMQIPTEVQNVVQKALEKKRENRFETADDMLKCLRDPTQTKITKTPLRIPEKYVLRGKYKWALVLTMHITTIIVTGLAVAWYFNERMRLLPASTGRATTAPLPAVQSQVPSAPLGDDATAKDFDLYLDHSGADHEDVISKIAHKNMKKLSLEHTSISDATLKAVADHCPHLQTLYVRHTGVSNEGLKHISDIPTMKALFLSYTRVNDEGMECIKDMSNLEALSISSTSVTDAGVTKLHRLKGLLWLHMFDTSVSDSSMAFVNSLPKLQDLSIGDTRITGRYFNKLPRSLDTLMLFKLHLNDSALNSLTHLQNLTELDLDDNPITDKSMDSLAKLPKLRVLSISGTDISNDGFARLSALPGLESLTANDLMLSDKGLAGLTPLTKLKTLDLASTKLGDSDLAPLKPLKLETLDLGYTDTGDKALATITSISTLTSLDIEHTQVSPAALLQLAKLPRLQSLNIEGIRMSPAQRAALQEAIPQCHIKH